MNKMRVGILIGCVAIVSTAIIAVGRVLKIKKHDHDFDDLDGLEKEAMEIIESDPELFDDDSGEWEFDENGENPFNSESTESVLETSESDEFKEVETPLESHDECDDFKEVESVPPKRTRRKHENKYVGPTEI